MGPASPSQAPTQTVSAPTAHQPPRVGGYPFQISLWVGKNCSCKNCLHSYSKLKSSVTHHSQAGPGTLPGRGPQ